MANVIEHLTETELRTTYAMYLDHGWDATEILAELLKREGSV